MLITSNSHAAHSCPLDPANPLTITCKYNHAAPIQTPQTHQPPPHPDALKHPHPHTHLEVVVCEALPCGVAGVDEHQAPHTLALTARLGHCLLEAVHVHSPTTALIQLIGQQGTTCKRGGGWAVSAAGRHLAGASPGGMLRVVCRIWSSSDSHASSVCGSGGNAEAVHVHGPTTGLIQLIGQQGTTCNKRLDDQSRLDDVSSTEPCP